MLQRLTHFSSDISGFQLTSKYAAHVRHVFLEGKSAFTAGRLEMLLMALPFVLRDLIDPELRLIEQAIRDGKVDKDARAPRRIGDDPCPDVIRALASFLDGCTTVCWRDCCCPPWTWLRNCSAERMS